MVKNKIKKLRRHLARCSGKDPVAQATLEKLIGKQAPKG
jgi:hypothetical protein